MGLKIPAGNAVHISLFSRQQQLMIAETVGVADAGVALRVGAGHSVGVALRGAGHSVGLLLGVALRGGAGHSVALRGAHELSTGEGTTPLPPSPFLAPATFSTSATSSSLEGFFP